MHADDPPAKHKILVTALALFVRDGLCETSVRDIAKASGFNAKASELNEQAREHERLA